VAWWVSAGLFFILGATYALATPLTGVPDEGAHTIRAVAVAHGQLTSKFHNVQLTPGFTKPETNVRVAKGYAVLDDTLLCLLGHVERPAVTCGQPVGPDGPTVKAETYVGTYPPTYYALVGWPSWFLGVRKAMYAMRFLTALIVALLLASAVRSLVEVADARGGARSWAMSGVALSATPVLMFVVGGVNPAGLEVAAACCLWATALAVMDGLASPAVVAVHAGSGLAGGSVPTRVLVRLVIAGALLVATRPLSPVLAFGVLVLSGVAAMQLRPPPWREVGALTAFAMIAILGVGAELAVVLAHSSTAVITSPPAGTEGRGWYLGEASRHTFTYLNELIGHLGWLDIPLSGLVIGAWAVAGLALVGLAAWTGTGRQRLALAGTALAVVVLPILAEVVSGPTVGMAWQGRYGLPLAVGLPITAAWILVRQPAPGAAPQLTARPTRSVLAWGGGLAIAAVVAGGQLAALVKVLNRYAAGLPSGVLAAFRINGGLGPFGWRASAWISVVVAVVLFAGLAWLAWAGSGAPMVRADSTSEPEPEPQPTPT
jgi:hypothetical protein